MRTIAHLRPAAALAVAALTLVACGADDGDTPADDPTTTTTTTTAPTGDDGTATTQAPLARCERVPESTDGVYDLGDAGEIEIAVDGDTVRLVEARPAAGWTATDDTEDDDDEVEVSFRGDGREIELEVELDDGRLEVEICDD